MWLRAVSSKARGLAACASFVAALPVIVVFNSLPLWKVTLVMTDTATVSPCCR